MNTSTQSQGMLSSPMPQPNPQQQGAYNGVVDVQGTSVRVIDGIAEYDGERYFVSNNGQMVVNEKRQVLGYIEDGQFKPIDANHIATLKRQGLIEEGG